MTSFQSARYSKGCRFMIIVQLATLFLDLATRV